jgi:GntR family transcriptional regulator/MocR family aminotransferase
VDLGLAVDRAATTPLPDQVEHALRARMGRAELRPGDALPSTRALATELEVSRGVIVEAYDRLVRQGLLVARQGAAVRVSDAIGSVGEAPTAPAAPTWRLRLHPAATPIGTLDRRAWGAATRAALREASEAAMANLDPVGDAGLRAAMAAQLSRSRGVVADPANIAITAGVGDSIRGLVPLLHARGGRIAVEEPGFLVHRSTLIGSGIDVVPIPADEHGIDVEALRAADVPAVLTTPAHQMPLGVPLSPERRAALVGWARERGALILEDDYDGELRYDRRGVRSLHALAPDRVIYMGSTSKVLSPAVRIGWLVSPPEVTGEVHGWRLGNGGAPSALIQLALAELVRSGGFDRSLARLRRRCAAQRAALVEALAAADATLTPTGVEAGLLVSVRVRGTSSWAIVAAANARGVELFAMDDGPDAIMLIGFGLVDPSAAVHVAAELAAIVAAARAAG